MSATKYNILQNIVKNQRITFTKPTKFTCARYYSSFKSNQVASGGVREHGGLIHITI